MLKSERLKTTPLHEAVIAGNQGLILQLKDSEWRNSLERNGFTPLQLAQLLGKKECQKLLQDSPSLKFKLQFKDQSGPHLAAMSDFEKKFHMVYRPFLTFSSYQLLEEVIRNCPYLLRFEWLVISEESQEALYQAHLAAGSTADVIVKWIDPQIGYGLFAEDDFPERTFIAEYTGIVRQVDKKNPKLNGYCFQYPVKFWSPKTFVIDALHEGNVSRFINHSDQPNLQPLWIVNRGLLHLIFLTNREVSKGTELTFDYGVDYWIHRKKYVI